MQKYDWLLSEYVLQEEFLRMSTIRYQFASVVQSWHFGFTDNRCNLCKSVTLQIYIYIRVLLASSQDPRNLWLCLACLVNNFDLPLWSRIYTRNWSLHHCMKKKTKVANRPKYSNFVTCFMPDRPLDNIKEFLIFWNSKNNKNNTKIWKK